MGNQCCPEKVKSQPPKTRAQLYYDNRTIYSAKQPAAKLRFWKWRSNDEILFVPSEVIWQDHKQTFEPIFHQGDAIFVPLLCFQQCVSDRKKYTLTSIEVFFTQLQWYPFMPKELRLQANKNVQDRAAETKKRLSEIFTVNQTYVLFKGASEDGGGGEPEGGGGVADKGGDDDDDDDDEDDSGAVGKNSSENSDCGSKETCILTG
jgi:hypothetical protein